MRIVFLLFPLKNGSGFLVSSCQVILDCVLVIVNGFCYFPPKDGLRFVGFKRVISWTQTENSVLDSCGERAPPLAKVLRKEAWHTQRRDRASGVSLKILEHLPPKPESAYFLLCAFTYTSDFMGGCPPLPLSEKRVSLQLQLIIPGCDSVSTYKLLWKSSSLPE